MIPANYSGEDLAGKAVCKRELLKEFGLPDSGQPLIGIVSRFAWQKGPDLIGAIGTRLFERNLTMVVLGSGERRYEEMFLSLAARFPDRLAVRLGFDEALAHRIEAGSDMFLMPSRFEPGGLNQIYSLRYGTVPIVRATGGLDESVDGETGFKFWGYDPESLLACVDYALAAYLKKDGWQKMAETGMSRDFSWEASARQYGILYSKLLSK